MQSSLNGHIEELSHVVCDALWPSQIFRPDHQFGVNKTSPPWNNPARIPHYVISYYEPPVLCAQHADVVTVQTHNILQGMKHMRTHAGTHMHTISGGKEPYGLQIQPAVNLLFHPLPQQDV